MYALLMTLWLTLTELAPKKTPRQRRPAFRPRLEGLEDRALPSSYSAATVSALIADITAANAAGGANTITLTAPTASPYVLTAVNNTTDGATGLPLIAANDNLTILGKGDTVERSTALGTAAFRLFEVAPGASLTLQNLTLQGGLVEGKSNQGEWAEGGAIYNRGTLTLNGATVQDNVAQGANGTGPGQNAYGGGIFSQSFILNGQIVGALTLEGGTTVEDNQAIGGVGYSKVGGEIAWRTGGYGYGGGVFVSGGTAVLTNTTLSSNTAEGGAGGAPGNASGGNGGYGLGGGLGVTGGTVSLTNDTLSSNTALGGQGGSANPIGGYIGGNGGNALGGGLYVSSEVGTVTLSNDTLSSNIAQGGAGASMTSYVTPTAASAGSGFGGALQVSMGTVSVSGSTLSTNIAQGGESGDSGKIGAAGGGYGGGVEVGPAAFSYGATVTLTNDTFSSNAATSGSGSNGPTPPSSGNGIYILSGDYPVTVDIDAFTLASVIPSNIYGPYTKT